MLIAREIIGPYEERTYTVNFPWLDAEELITIVQHTIEPDDGIFRVDQLVIDTGQKTVRFKAIGGGTGTNDAEEYVVNLLTTTNLTNVNDDCVRFIVSCDGCC